MHVMLRGCIKLAISGGLYMCQLRAQYLEQSARDCSPTFTCMSGLHRAHNHWFSYMVGHLLRIPLHPKPIGLRAT